MDNGSIYSITVIIILLMIILNCDWCWNRGLIVFEIIILNHSSLYIFWDCVIKKKVKWWNNFVTLLNVTYAGENNTFVCKFMTFKFL